MTIFIGWLADTTHQRGLYNISVSLLGIIGFSMLLGGHSAGVRYAGTFLGALGIYPCIPNTISWISNNVEGVYKRGVTLGIIIGWGNLNGIVSCNIYRTVDKPRYILGHSVVLAYLVVSLLGGSVLQRLLLQAENAKRRSGKRDHRITGKSAEQIKLLGDGRYVTVYP